MPSVSAPGMTRAAPLRRRVMTHRHNARCASSPS